MALLTVLALVGKPIIPPKTLLIHPAPDTVASIYGPSDLSQGAVAQWIDQERNEWLCDYKMLYGHLNCGLSFSWNWLAGSGASDSAYPECERADTRGTGNGLGREQGQNCKIAQSESAASSRGPTQQLPLCTEAAVGTNGGGRGAQDRRNCIPAVGSAIERSPLLAPKRVSEALNSIDFSTYHGLKVSIHYEGRANFLRLFLRNFNPKYSDYRDSNSSKFMSAFVRTEDLKAGPAYVSLNDFSVDEWWALQNDLPRALTAPEFDRIVNLGVDHVEHGMHRMRVDRIELVGERISTENFLIIMLLIWVAYLSLEGVLHYYSFRSASRQRALQIDQFSSQAQLLEQENKSLQSQSFTDPLTEIFNRAGLERNLEGLRSGVDTAVNLGLMVIDIDHFKRANDTYGHKWGDQALTRFAKLIKTNTREDDIFARWSGEEFVLITRHASHKSLIAMAEKLRVIVSEEKFAGADDLKMTVSIGLTTLNDGEAFYAAFKRADIALSQAKVQRNCVVYGD